MDNNNNFQQPQYDYSQQPVQPQYVQQPVQYAQQPVVAQAQPAKPLAIIGMICGISSLVSCWWGSAAISGLFAGIAAIILCSLAKKKGNESGMVKAGLIMGIIGTVLSGLFFVICTAAGACGACGACASATEEYYYYIRMFF